MSNMFLCIASLLVLHMDMNSIRMRRDAIVDHLREASSMGYNAVLWEVEDKIKWETCPECVHPEAFSKREFREILAEAESLGLEPIPLMQTFAHAEYILSHEKYRPWREVDANPTCYCVSKPDVDVFVFDELGREVKGYPYSVKDAETGRIFTLELKTDHCAAIVKK